jgi:probable rRNA maturation factor
MIRAEMNQLLLKGGQRFPAKRLKQILRFMERIAGPHPFTVSIAFVSAPVMRKANRIYRKKDRVTDVLSFHLAPDHGELLLYYGRARKQAQQMKHSVSDEITFLIVHGMLHLFGHDHEHPRDAKAMFSIQEKILEALRVNPFHE